MHSIHLTKNQITQLNWNYHHTPADTSGIHLRANYTLSFGGLFELPNIPMDEEYCSRFDKSLEPYQLPKFDVAALQAARFAELALGALVDSSCNCCARRPTLRWMV